MVVLLPLEHGMAVRAAREYRLSSRLLLFDARVGADDDVDLVLLTGATAVLQEGSLSQAAHRALELRALHPKRIGLAELAEAVHGSDDVFQQVTYRYMTAAGYTPDRIGAFHVIGDVYLGRVHRELTHPALGAGCVAYFAGAGRLQPAIRSTTDRCSRLWADWRADDSDLDSIEQQAREFADEWVTRRVRDLP